MGELPAGTKLKILAERGGWRQVETPDGKTGFVWAEHLTEDGDESASQTESKPEAQKPEPSKAPSSPSSMADDLRALREDVKALRERPEPAAAHVERLRSDVDRLAQAQRELAQHIEDRTPTGPGGDPPPDGTLTFAPLLLLVGGVIGWLASRLTSGRRNRRLRNRLRF